MDIVAQHPGDKIKKKKYHKITRKKAFWMRYFNIFRYLCNS